MRRFRRLAAVLAFSLSLAACVSAPDQDFTRDDVVRGFELVAFGREFANREASYVIKFDHPVHVHVVHEAGDDAPVEKTRAVIATIEGFHRHPDFAPMTSAPVDEEATADLEDADVLVMALGSENYEAFYERVSERWIESGKLLVADHFYFSRCGANIVDTKGRIRRAVVFLDVDDMSPLLDECLSEEILQSLGLPDDDDSLIWSMFNDSNDVKWPGAYDNLLISVLYSDRILPGMSRKDAMKIVPSIVRELWPDHLKAMQATAGG